MSNSQPNLRVGATPYWTNFEQFSAGDVVHSPGRTITDADLLMFSALTGCLHSPLHSDREWVREHTDLEDRVAPGTMTFSYGLGMLSATLAYQGAVLAMLGVENLRFREPVLPGDTIHTEATVVSK